MLTQKKKNAILKTILLVLGIIMVLKGLYVLVIAPIDPSSILINWGMLPSTWTGFSILAFKMLGIFNLFWGVLLLTAYRDPLKNSAIIYISLIFFTLMALVIAFLSYIPAVIQEINEIWLFVAIMAFCIMSLLLIFFRPRKEETFLAILKLKVKDLF